MTAEIAKAFILPAVVSGVVAWIASGWVSKNGKKLGIMDDPKKHKHPKVTHTQAVPRGGGIAIFLSLAVGAILFLPKNITVLGIMGGALILAITGWADDRFEEKISPYVRLVLNILAALCVIGVGIGIAYITNPAGGVFHLDTLRWCTNLWGGTHCLWLLADIFALLWLVWMQNMVGWSSGVDGQLPGFVIMASITMALLALRFEGDYNQWMVITLAGILAGAYAGFLPWNWFPQRIMPGYGGKSLAGFVLGTLAILSSAKVGAMLLVLGVPFVDAVLVIIKRIREKRSPVWGGREHLHHMLLDLGWSKSRIAAFYWGVSAILGLAAWQLKAPAKFYTMAAIVLTLAGIIWWLQNWLTYSKQQDQDSG